MRQIQADQTVNRTPHLLFVSHAWRRTAISETMFNNDCWSREQVVLRATLFLQFRLILLLRYNSLNKLRCKGTGQRVQAHIV